MPPEVTAALAEILTPVLSALALAAAGWLVSKLPGPLRDALTANVHAKDVAVLVGAMQRRAVAEVANAATPAPTPADIIAYVERVRGDLLAKMQVAPEALETMAAAAIVQAEAVPAAAPSDVLVTPPRILSP